MAKAGTHLCPPRLPRLACKWRALIGVAIAGAVVAIRQAQLAAAGFSHPQAFGAALGVAFLVSAAIAGAGVVPSLVRGWEERRAGPGRE